MNLKRDLFNTDNLLIKRIVTTNHLNNWFTNQK